MSVTKTERGSPVIFGKPCGSIFELDVSQLFLLIRFLKSFTKKIFELQLLMVSEFVLFNPLIVAFFG